MHHLIKPNTWAAFRLPSDALRILPVVPNTTLSLGKYGSFQSNNVLGRPYNLTYELLDKQEGQPHGGLRIVPASELHADVIAEEEAGSEGSPDEKIIIGGDGVEFELVGKNGQVMMRSNRETIDSTAHQTLTMEEIEALKRDGSDAGKELVARLMLSHTAIDQKTAFSLSKYKLLKTKKYLRRFTILPLDVSLLTQWLVEDKDPSRIMEMREEMLALAGCWANVHFSGYQEDGLDLEHQGGRWLVVDEVGGLLVAAMAERMGILYPPDEEEEDPDGSQNPSSPRKPRRNTNDQESEFAATNTITLIHSNAQPNLSLLKYFSFIPDSPPPGPPHPLTQHLKSISWLQLLQPAEDTTYATPPPSATPEEISAWKSGKRGTYYRKRRRYFRTRSIVDSTRAGHFDGLLIASNMDPVSVLRPLIPLLRGGAPVTIYSPTIEPLTQLADMYSMSRRTAFIKKPPEDFLSFIPYASKTSEPSTPSNPFGTSSLSNPSTPAPPTDSSSTTTDLDPSTSWSGNYDFPLNPTLLLNINVQTSRLRKWQVLPGRTHPLMTGRGGAEGYLFTATRVIPAGGRVEARGRFRGFKKRRLEAEEEGEGNVANEGSKLKNEVRMETAMNSGQERMEEDGGMEAIEAEYVDIFADAIIGDLRTKAGGEVLSGDPLAAGGL